ncbi:hypothetical protein, partial [uncultured Roseobacter sp.]|uniref:hypothetical protein n=1 Tax=uncultured Roseobacter sp. TaxID=114847 RepID=UPI002610D9E6
FFAPLHVPKLVRSTRRRVFHQYRSFLSLTAAIPQTVKNLVPQTLGEIRFDIVTFLTAVREADIGALCSIMQLGLKADLR